MKVKLHVTLSDAATNIETTLRYTGIHYPTTTIVHEAEVEIPDPPEGFAIDSVTIALNETEQP